MLNELKNRGVKDILIICADGLSGIKEAIAAAYPKTEYQRCIVYQVRNILKYVADKDSKPFVNDLKNILLGSVRRAGSGGSGKGNRKMVYEIPEFHEKLEAKLGCNLPDFQVFCRSKESYLYHKSDRIIEFYLSEFQEICLF